MGLCVTGLLLIARRFQYFNRNWTLPYEPLCRGFLGHEDDYWFFEIPLQYVVYANSGVANFGAVDSDGLCCNRPIV